LWTPWGILRDQHPYAFTLAYLALSDLQPACSLQVALRAQVLFQEACLHLTQGQHMDIGYETRRDLTEADYWPMIEGKTAALLSACTGLGALVGGADGRATAYRRLGSGAGLRVDDIRLSGDAALIKSAGDLVDGEIALCGGGAGRGVAALGAGPVPAAGARPAAQPRG
jgi:geranylgeranyl pyrophosphate synthase